MILIKNVLFLVSNDDDAAARLSFNFKEIFFTKKVINKTVVGEGMNGLVVGGTQKMGELKIGATPTPSPAPSAAGQTMEPPKQQFGRIRLDIWNSVLPREKLSPTPSQKDGLSEDLEKEIRSLGCDLIQLAGKLLKLPQVSHN